MTKWQKLGWLVMIFGLCELPAYANNPPQPDGLFSILLIFPLIILGMRLAGVSRIQKSLWKRIATGFVLTVCALLAAGGTEIALLPLLVIFAYGIRRGIQIIRLGQGRKRIWIAAAIFAWVPIAFMDYGASLMDYENFPAKYEAQAMSRLRTLASAESQYRESHNQGEAAPPIASILDLRKAGMIDAAISSGEPFGGYVYREIIDRNKGQYLFYAVPAFPARRGPYWWHAVPGGTLISELFHIRTPEGTGEQSITVDETGVIRWARRDITKPVTREEAEHWQSFP
ncbi:MAG TPA: hypothetical protein VLV88_13135 [Terriglobales bacterium]|nr:hypothetical protein [Terriglobales bacterium]